jgi:hypothetical protein
MGSISCQLDGIFRHRLSAPPGTSRQPNAPGPCCVTAAWQLFGFHGLRGGGDVIAGSAWCDNLPHTVQAPMEENSGDFFAVDVPCCTVSGFTFISFW